MPGVLLGNQVSTYRCNIGVFPRVIGNIIHGFPTEHPKVKERDISYVNYADDMHSIHLQKFPSSCTVR